MGYYSLYALVDDGEATAEDGLADNPDELLVTSAGENIPPVVPSDATFASPAGVDAPLLPDRRRGGADDGCSRSRKRRTLPARRLLVRPLGRRHEAETLPRFGTAI